ncbi:MAG: hypothetical protein ACJ77K_05795 [Bacteroidia bacterium]
MLKYAALLFNTVALLIYQFFFADGITVTQNIPATAKAESEFTVELTINKGTIGGFAKLQQDLPEGFTAVKGDDNGATFTFSNQSVKFIWMSLPSDKEFKVKYTVKVAAGVSGDKSIGGKFSYVSDNVKQSIDIAPSMIRIGDGASTPVADNAANTTPATTGTTPPDNTSNTTTTTTPANTTTEPATTTASNTTDKTPDNLTTQLVDKSTTPTNTGTEPTTTTPANNEVMSSLNCIRTVTAGGTDNWNVEVAVNKGNITGFAKLLETLPAGFTATAGETQGASFSFDASTQKVKFVWVSMPSQTEFRVSYKITASGVSGSQPIDGVFSYIENDETKKFTIPTSMVTAGGAMATNNTNTNTTANNTTTNNTTDNAANNTTNNNNTNNTAANNTTANNTTDNTNTNSTQMSATSIPSPQGNVNYKVQIMALHNPVDANKLATRYNINAKINTEMAEGFTKYTVGSHNEYKEARDAREDMKNKGVVAPFVTAYNSGKRITVQEALMITSQKWYR